MVRSMAESVKMSRLRGIIVSVRLFLILEVKQARLLFTKNTESTSIYLLRTALANVDGAHSKIVLVHLPDSSITYLVEGDELWHPSLWVRETASSSSSESVMKNVLLDEDSAGFYVKTNEFQEAHWSYKMELVWTYMDQADVVVLGSSRPHHGVIPALFSDQFFVVNLASAHGNLHSSHYMAVNYVLPNYKKLKYIIIEIALDRL